MDPCLKILVVIPTFNERENLPKIIRQTLVQSENIQVLVVDDNSPDGTGNVAETLAREFPQRVWVLHRSKKKGLGSAYIEGFQWGLSRKFDLFIEMDGDGSHNPSEIQTLLRASTSAEVVIGSRYIDGIRILNWPMRRLILSYFSNILTRWMTQIPLMDCTGGFKCFHRQALERIPLQEVHGTGYDFQIEMNALCHWTGLRFAEVPITFSNRIHGTSKLTRRDVIRAAGALVRLGLKRFLPKRLGKRLAG